MIAEKRELNYRKIGIIAVSVIAIIALLTTLIIKGNSNPGAQSSPISGLSIDELKSETKVSKQHQTLQDYLFYGNSLYLFSKPYQSKKDEIANNKLLLEGINNDRQYNFIIESGLDRGILLNMLENGCYKLYIVSNLNKTLATYKKSIQQSIYINNGEESKKITLMSADKVNGEKNNYTLLINVENGTPKKEQYDIILDPAGNTSDLTEENGVNKGSKGNGISEAKISYDYCKTLKQKLEAEGFKVLIARKSKEVKDEYGKDGRINLAYRYHAKYYLHIGVSENEEKSYRGLSITTSSYASNILANKLIYNLVEHTPIKLDTLTTNPNNPGVAKSPLYEGDNGKRIYDSDLSIREVGGKATNAASFSQAASDLNGDFAKNNPYGCQGISISLGYVSNAKDAKLMRKSKDEICAEIAKTLSEYIKEDD